MSHSLIIEDNVGPLKKAVIGFLKLYIKHAPTTAGKGIITKHMINPLLPDPPGHFMALTPNKAKVNVHYKSVLGRVIYLKDVFFEEAEIRELCRYAKSGVVIDIGANIGIYSVSWGKEIGSRGQVWAFEPLEVNINDIKENMTLNSLDNYKLFQMALGDSNGSISLSLSDDAMFASIAEVYRGDNNKTINVEMKKLDDVWSSEGKPRISAMKIDVEGAEINVLNGAAELIAENKPPILLEAPTKEQLDTLNSWLAKYGYKHTQPVGFEPWNYLFLAE